MFFIHKGRTCSTVADHLVFKISRFTFLLYAFCALHGPGKKCVGIQSGHFLPVSKGTVPVAFIKEYTWNIYEVIVMTFSGHD